MVEGELRHLSKPVDVSPRVEEALRGAVGETLAQLIPHVRTALSKSVRNTVSGVDALTAGVRWVETELDRRLGTLHPKDARWLQREARSLRESLQHETLEHIQRRLRGHLEVGARKPLLQGELEPERLQSLRKEERKLRRHLNLPPRRRRG